MPIEAGRPSVNARAGSWQVAHATLLSADNLPSKNNFWPRAIFSGVCGLSAGVTDRVSSIGSPTCCRELRLARGPALGSGGAFPAGCPVGPAKALSSPRNPTPSRLITSAVLMTATMTKPPKDGRFWIDMAPLSFLSARPLAGVTVSSYPPRPVTVVRTRPLFTNAHSAAVACQWSSRMTHRGQPHGDPGDSLGDRQLLDGGFIRIALAAHAPFDFS